MNYKVALNVIESAHNNLVMAHFTSCDHNLPCSKCDYFNHDTGKCLLNEVYDRLNKLRDIAWRNNRD